VLADDHRLMREAVRRVLETREGMELVAEAAAGDSVVATVAEADPDLVLLDVAMPRVDGLTALVELRRQFPDLPVVMLSAFARPEYVSRAAEAGARGYVLKTVPPEVLLDLVEEIAGSEASPFVTRGVEHAPTGDARRLLTKRELTVLAAIGRGLSTREISRELWVTEPTVKFHVRNIYAKLGLRNRTDAAAYAVREGIVPERRRR
jgi:DNA-binding NarL/FixJ family response regulator